jgi:hypothetical protein
MRGMRLVCIVAGVAVAGMVAPVGARTPASCVGIEMTAGECKVQTCKKLFERNLAACAELPSNKSCPSLAREQRRQCDQTCDAKHPKRFPPGYTCDKK